VTAIINVPLENPVRISHFIWGQVTVPPSVDSEITVRVRLSDQDVIDIGNDQVFLQASQAILEESNYPDAFALQIIEITQAVPRIISIRVRRVDGDQGWGQHLVISILITKLAG
jgi:hypothetical protein